MTTTPQAMGGLGAIRKIAVAALTMSKSEGFSLRLQEVGGDNGGYWHGANPRLQ